MSPVRTLAKGEWYSALIIAIKLCLKPKRCNTAHIYFHSILSKAFPASSENMAQGFGCVSATSIMCSSLLILSDA